MSKWKPGQLVTINHAVYRIRSTKGTLLAPCAQCAFRHHPMTSPSDMCVDCGERIGISGYYEKVCGKQDK